MVNPINNKKTFIVYNVCFINSFIYFSSESAFLFQSMPIVRKTIHKTCTLYSIFHNTAVKIILLIQVDAFSVKKSSLTFDCYSRSFEIFPFQIEVVTPSTIKKRCYETSNNIQSLQGFICISINQFLHYLAYFDNDNKYHEMSSGDL